MPRVTYLKSAQKKEPEAPAIDWLKAVILERIDALDFNLKTLAAAAGIGYENMRKLMTKSPWDWKRQQRADVCRVLGISEEVLKRTAGF